MDNKLCPYCIDIGTASDPLLKVCDCTVVNPIHRECLDHFRAVNTDAIKKCPTCKVEYITLKVGEKEQKRNVLYYRLRLFTEVSLLLGTFLYTGFKLSDVIRHNDNTHGGPVSVILGSYYKLLSFSAMFSTLGIYGMWFDRNVIISNLKNLLNLIFSYFKEMLLQRSEETSEQRTERNLREIQYELKNVVKEIKKQNDPVYQKEQKRKKEEKNENDEKYGQLSLVTKFTTVVVIGTVFFFGATGLFYAVIKGPLMVSEYIESKRLYYRVRSESANLRVLAFNLKSDRKLARDELGIELPVHD